MMKDHVAIDMEETPNNKNIEYFDLRSDSRDEVEYRSKLKNGYKGCSCNICYQRYKFSKQPHSCTSKERCHVVRKQKVKDLEAIDTDKNDKSCDMLLPTNMDTACEINIGSQGDLRKVCIPEFEIPQ